MRTTINLSDETHNRLLSRARDTGQSLSATVDTLLRRAMYLDDSSSVAAIHVDPESQLPVISFGRRITIEDVRALDDDA